MAGAGSTLLKLDVEPPKDDKLEVDLLRLWAMTSAVGEMNILVRSFLVAPASDAYNVELSPTSSPLNSDLLCWWFKSGNLATDRRYSVLSVLNPDVPVGVNPYNPLLWRFSSMF